MDDDDKYQRFSHIPIPTYDEAIFPRPGSSQDSRGPGEVSDDAERQGLLPRPVSYRPPTAESPRSSQDSDADLSLPEMDGSRGGDGRAGGDDERRRVEELDYLDPSAPDPDQRQSRLYHRARLRTKLSQHLSNWGATLSSIRLPSFRSLYTPVSVSASLDADSETPPPRRFAWLSRPLPRVPDQYRMSCGNTARFLGLLALGLLVYALFLFDIIPTRGTYSNYPFNPEAVRGFVQEKVDAGRIEEYLAHITSYDHVAGTQGDLFMAEWMRERWVEEGNLDDIKLLSYYVYLNYPTEGGRSLAIVSPEKKKWVAKLEEPVVDQKKQQTLAWHGNSKTGEAEGHLIYANGGSRGDFAWLRDQGVVLNGSIALMRHYSTQADQALKVKAAEEAGCVGALIFSDPSDDGSAKGAVWPKGPWRPDDSVQRGSVALSSWVMGDPLTPGQASKMDADRLAKHDNPGLNQIPSLPISWQNAKALIRSTQGIGTKVPPEWRGGDKSSPRDWFTGADGQGAPIVHLKNINDENDKQQIWNLHGMIQGLEQPDKKVYIGSHRDAWCFGSVDPGSGSAVLMEMVQIFGHLRALGWRPLRTIDFVSWDAKEYNMMGSTEFVEDNVDVLRENSVAYLNVDSGVYGPDPVFRAAGSPMLQPALLHVLDRVSIPGDENTLRQIWDDRNSQLESPGFDGDYAAFQNIAGTSSLDFGFQGAKHAFPSHSCYETLGWMQKFGDPEFTWHRTLAQVWALLILELSDRPILPYDLRGYVNAIQGTYLQHLQGYAEEENKKAGGKPELLKELGFDLQPLHQAVQHLTEAVETFSHFEEVWTINVLGSGGLESASFANRRLEYNNRLSNFERDLLDLPSSPDDTGAHGMPGREQFKHILFGPQPDSSDSLYFPAVADALNRGNFSEAQTWVERAAAILTKAANNLVE